MNRHHLTPEGYDKLVAELRNFKEVVRPQIVRDIEEARAHGDISENSEYEDAKERQAHCEGRIAYLENVLAASEIVDITKLSPSSRVVFGTTVLLADSESGDERRWRIVGEIEADLDKGSISYV
ncbi:MAG: transcription elongation factor GreA, partial [Myxococcales bacterium]|nr:transcription elongation factor GreA [Myxococcales bacterium]